LQDFEQEPRTPEKQGFLGGFLGPLLRINVAPGWRTGGETPRSNILSISDAEPDLVAPISILQSGDPISAFVVAVAWTSSDLPTGCVRRRAHLTHAFDRPRAQRPRINRRGDLVTLLALKNAQHGVPRLQAHSRIEGLTRAGRLKNSLQRLSAVLQRLFVTCSRLG
jgi:hypothetical protein